MGSRALWPQPRRRPPRTVARAMFRNALMIGLMLGFLVNLGHLPYPAPLRAGVEMMANSALPAALFGLGGVLSRYRIRASARRGPG